MMCMHPVPIWGGLPTTSLADGDSKGSVDPARTACRRKLVAVSKLIFRKGEAWLAIPMRLQPR